MTERLIDQLDKPGDTIRLTPNKVKILTGHELLKQEDVERICKIFNRDIVEVVDDDGGITRYAHHWQKEEAMDGRR
jgi:hypothetical protein